MVGLVAKSLHPGSDPVGLLPTIGFGIAGSFVGGFINWMLGNGISPVSDSGLLMGVVGALLLLAGYRYYRLKVAPPEPKSFWTGK